MSISKKPEGMSQEQYGRLQSIQTRLNGTVPASGSSPVQRAYELKKEVGLSVGGDQKTSVEQLRAKLAAVQAVLDDESES